MSAASGPAAREDEQARTRGVKGAVMVEQLDFFGAPAPPAWPEGFAYAADVVSPEWEQNLLKAIRDLPFQEFAFHGFAGKRRTVSFGATYDFAHERLQPADPLPADLHELRERVAEFGRLPAEQLRQVLVTEYRPGSGIGWHRDKAVFGQVVGVSLLSACRFRMRRRQGERWERVTVEAAPRSAYLLSGAARTVWEHSIPEVETLRYSITFRTLGS